MAAVDLNQAAKDLANGGKVHIPLYLVLAAIIALAGYTAKLNSESAQIQRETVRVIERMDTRNKAEFERVHSEHQDICQQIRCTPKRTP